MNQSWYRTKDYEKILAVQRELGGVSYEMAEKLCHFKSIENEWVREAGSPLYAWIGQNSRLYKRHKRIHLVAPFIVELETWIDEIGTLQLSVGAREDLDDITFGQELIRLYERSLGK